MKTSMKIDLIITLFFDINAIFLSIFNHDSNDCIKRFYSIFG